LITSGTALPSEPTMGGGTSTNIATVDVFRDITFCVIMADGGGGSGHADKKIGSPAGNGDTLPTPQKVNKSKVRTITNAIDENGKSISLPPGTVTHIKFVCGRAIVTIVDKDGDGNINNEIQQVMNKLNKQSIQCG